MLGVFPLNIVVLPNESVALHIFEPRYIELFQDYKNGKDFVILYDDGKKSSKFGTTVFVEQVINEYPDGTADVIVKGKEIVEIVDFIEYYPDKLYSAVKVKKNEIELTINKRLRVLYKAYRESNDKQFNQNLTYSIYQIANHLSLNQETKNELIALKSNIELNKFLINEIRFILRIKEQENLLNNNFSLN